MKFLIFLLLFLSLLFSQNKYAYSDSMIVKDPQLAWKLSFIPGLGQIYNERYFKAVVLWTMEMYAIYQWNSYNSNKKVAKRNTFGWWIIGLYIVGMIDAYVDAQLSTFPDSEKEIKESKK